LGAWRGFIFTPGLLIAAGLLAPACGSADEVADTAPVARTQQADVIDNLAKKYLDAADYKDFSAFYKLAADIAGAYTGVSAAISAYQALSTLLSSGDNPPIEQVMLAQLDKIKQELNSVLTAITDASWIQAERDASTIYADAAYAAKTTRDWVLQHPGETLDLNTPLGSDVDSKSWEAAHIFMDDGWYWFPGPNGRHFDHRLALPRLTNTIAIRIGVLEATAPGFVGSSAADTELAEYYDRLGGLLNEIENYEIQCYTPQIAGPIYPGSDLSKVIIRRCKSSITGTDLVVSTAAQQNSEAPFRAALLNELGLGPVRALRDKLYALIQDLPNNRSFCGNEEDTCWVSGAQTVRYGDQAAFFYRTENGPISCSNDLWNDPDPGMPKHCDVGDVSWYPCADEGSRCYFYGPKVVRYGVPGAYVTRLLSDVTDCNNAVFGDPAVGQPKHCEYADPIWTKCSDEWSSCSVSGSHYIRFGWGDSWNYATRSGTFSCDNGQFGDPAPGLLKACEFATAF
jgi:hypothetical protein